LQKEARKIYDTFNITDLERLFELNTIIRKLEEELGMLCISFSQYPDDEKIKVKVFEKQTESFYANKFRTELFNKYRVK